MSRGGSGVLVLRIQAALNRPHAQIRERKTVLAAAASVFVLAAIAAVFATPIKDRRVSMAEAQRLAAIARQGSAFPITMNERVHEQLNLLLATPDGRAFIRAGLSRMGAYQAAIHEQIERYGLPPELLAVPLMESGFRNLPPGANARHGAGLWMFIESTAKRYGLEMSSSHDARLDVAAETDAAMRLFSSLQSSLKDWHLALLAYNSGQGMVERGIRDVGSRDAWRLDERGYRNEPGYLPRAMAVIVILKNPDLFALDP
jgi:hypothetical protein